MTFTGLVEHLYRNKQSGKFSKLKQKTLRKLKKTPNYIRASKANTQKQSHVSVDTKTVVDIALLLAMSGVSQL